MKLRKLSSDEITARLERSFRNEIAALENKLNNEIDKRPLRTDVYAINSVIESLQQRMIDTSNETSGQLSTDFANIASALNTIDATDDVINLQEQVRSIKSSMFALQTKTPEVKADHDDIMTFLLEEIKKLEARIDRQQAQAIPKFYNNAAIGKGGGSAVEIQYDGNTITEEATCINFTGTDVLVQENGDCVDVFIPPPDQLNTNLIRRPFSNEIQMVFDDIPGEPLVQVYIQSAPISIPALYSDLDTMLYGLSEYNQSNVPVTRGWSWEQQSPDYIVNYAQTRLQLIIDFLVPQSGTIVISY